MGSLKSSTLTHNEILGPPPAVGYASAASSNAVTCEECQAGSAALVDRLLSEASLTEQGEILKALVCPQTEDPASCEAAVDMWFGDMATCIYNHFVLEADVCSRLGLCKKVSIFTPRDWTCEECTDIIAELLTTWLLMKPLLMVLNICKENASVARTDTLTTVVPLSPPSSLWPCLSLLVSS